MDYKELKILINIVSSVVVTFTTEQNLQKITEIRKNVEDMADDTVEFAQELLKDSAATAKIIEQLFLDVMINAGLQTPKVTSRGIDKDTLKALRKEIQVEYQKRMPVKEDGKTVID